MSEGMQTVKISVRDLVEFVMRSGDIDNRFAGIAEKEAMLMGGRLHRKIQRMMGASYRAEVPLKMQVPCERFLLQIEGRADGIIEEETETGPEVTVDEIKGRLRDPDHLEGPVSVHLSQAKCYAYMYASIHHLETIKVQMTYCHLETEKIRRFHFSYKVEQLKEWFDELVRQYEKWALFQIDWKEERDRSVKALAFPFVYREGQRELAASVYRTILRKKKLFIQAPTGTGKTLSTVFPAVKAVGEGIGEKIFYLTARTITRTAAEQAFGILKDNGLRMKTVTLTAKEKICFCEEAVCDPDHCPVAKGHYDRINDAVFDLLVSGRELSREEIENQAREKRVCPFELSLDLTVWADAVICDYNYVFDPSARLKRFFSEGEKGGHLFLIDEAHNLVDRGREMYSAVLYKEEIAEISKEIKRDDRKLSEQLSEVNRQFLALKRECETYRLLDSVSHVAMKLLGVLGSMEDYLEEHIEGEKREQVLDLYFKIRFFLDVYDLVDENYVIYSELGEDDRFFVKLFCINPAENLKSCLAYGNSTVFFSATLLPITYYRKLLPSDEEDYAVYAESSFPKENRLLLIGRDVSTRYTMRGPALYRKLASYIRKAVSGKQGNYMAFFPSYRLMEEVYACFTAEEGQIDCIMQSREMGERQREEFLDAFCEDRGKSLVGFCVMGGIFSEGIDLAEDRLIGAVIAGTGIPQVCSEREIIKNYFDARGMQGFAYAYMYPGMNKVLQAAGRVIRTEKDRGVIFLLDDRFLLQRYRDMFPREWDVAGVCTAETAESYMEGFWK